MEDKFQEELYDWLNELDLQKPKRNLARDFSDGVYVAEILKKTYPKLVDLHNYSPANSTSNKLKNWDALNEKVLQKIGISLPKNLMKEVVGANKSAVEKVLQIVKKNVTDEKVRREEEDREDSRRTSEDGIIVDVDVKSTVPYEEYKMVTEQLEQKNEVIEELHRKVTHLEVLLSLKNQRLSDLSRQAEKCTCGSHK